MSQRASSERPFELGDWRVDPLRGVLAGRETGAEVRLEPQLMDLLLLFAASPGRVIGKDEIIQQVWSGRAIGDDTLAGAVSRLRGALGETRERRYIETVPKRGYRLAPAAAPAPGGYAPPLGPEFPAQRLVEQGLASLRAPSPVSLPQARLYFEAAIREDPACAQAHGGLAETLLTHHLAGLAPASAVLPAAMASAHAAVGLDPGLASAWTALGYATLLSDRDFARADAALVRAISLDATAPAAHRYRGFALATVGRFVEAEREMRQAIALDPLSLSARGVLMQMLLMARRYRPALNEAKAVLALAPQASEAWYSKGWAHVLLGEEAEGVESLLKGLALWGLDEASLDSLRAAHAADGFPGLCAAGADLFERQKLMFAPRPTDIALLRAAAGQADLAFAALDAAAARDDPYLLMLPFMPWFDALKTDPRWETLAERVRPVR